MLKRIGRRAKGHSYGLLRRAALEALEDRRMLAAPILDAIDNVTMTAAPGGGELPKTIEVPLTASDADGNALTYTVSSSNTNIAPVLHSGNPWLRLRVQYKISVPDSSSGEMVTETREGDMDLMLFQDWAPETVQTFLGLVQAGFYDNLAFHRILPTFMAQGGDPLGTGSGGPGFSFPDEFNQNLMFSNSGLLAMANSGDDTNGSQFFITDAATPWLDFNHTIFGQLVRGKDTRIAVMATPLSDPQNGVPVDKPQILSARLITDSADNVLTLKALRPGTATITVTVNDGHGGTDQKTFTATAGADASGSIATQIKDTSIASPLNEPSFDVADGGVFRADDVIVVDAERMLVTGVSGNTLTVTRGFGSTSHVSIANGQTIAIYGHQAGLINDSSIIDPTVRTSFTVNNGALFKVNDEIQTGNSEIMLVTGISGDTLTVTRGFNNTTPEAIANFQMIAIVGHLTGQINDSSIADPSHETSFNVNDGTLFHVNDQIRAGDGSELMLVTGFAGTAAGNLNDPRIINPATRTSFLVSDGSLFQVNDKIQAAGSSEVMLVTGVSGSTLTVTRGYNGTIPTYLGSAQTLTIIYRAAGTINDATIAPDNATTRTEFAVSDGTRFRAGDQIQMIGGSEEMQITGINGNTLTVTRAFNGTIAVPLINGRSILVIVRSAGQISDPSLIDPTTMSSFVVSNAALLHINDLIRCGGSDELMLVTDVDVVNNILTVTRGHNGTTPEAVVNGQAITIGANTLIVTRGYRGTTPAPIANSQGIAIVGSLAGQINDPSVVDPAATTSFVVDDASQIQVGDKIRAGDSTEDMLVTAVVESTLTVTRGAAGTTPVDLRNGQYLSIVDRLAAGMISDSNILDPDNETSFDVLDGTQFKINDEIQVEGSQEIMQVTVIEGNTLYVSRGYSGSTSLPIYSDQVLNILRRPDVAQISDGSIIDPVNLISFVVDDGSRFRKNDEIQAGTNSEIMLVITAEGNTLTVGRGFKGARMKLANGDALSIVGNVSGQISDKSISALSRPSFSVTDGSKFKVNDKIQATGNEKMLVTAVDGNTLTVTRAYDDTSAVAIANGQSITILDAPAGRTLADANTTASLVVADGGEFTVGDQIVNNGAANPEIMLVTAIADDTLTVTRKYAGTAAATVALGQSVSIFKNTPAFLRPITNYATLVNQPVTIDLTAIDLENDPLAFDALVTDNVPRAQLIKGNNGARLTIVPDPGWTGVINLIVGANRSINLAANNSDSFDTQRITITVSQPQIHGQITAFSAVAGSSSDRQGLVATFTCDDKTMDASQFASLINWGDGAGFGLGTVTQSGNQFYVFGAHTYAREGTYPLSVQIVTGYGAAGTAATDTTAATQPAIAQLGATITVTGTIRVGPGSAGKIVDSSINDALNDTSFDVSDGSLFQANDQIRVGGSTELMLVTAVTGNTLTVTRGFKGTTRAGIADDQTITVLDTQINAGDAIVACAGKAIDQIGSVTTSRTGTLAATVNYGDGSGTVSLTLDANNYFQLKHTYTAAGNRTITITVNDGSGTPVTQQVAVTVLAAAKAKVGGGKTGLFGTNQIVTLAPTDPSAGTSGDDYWYSINWGDGSPAQITTQGVKNATHKFAAAGTFNVKVQIFDRWGNAGSTATYPITVGSAMVLADPAISGQKALMVAGTDRNDNIQLGIDSRFNVIVTINSKKIGTFTWPSAKAQYVYVWGLAGNDTVTASSNFPYVLTLFGGIGNDTLSGGANATVMVGGGGNDTLKCGAGQTIAIGGIGADRLVGGKNDDFLVGSNSAYEDDPGSLLSLISEWSRYGAPYVDRFLHLTGTGNGSNGQICLDKSTVADDSAVDTLTGGGGLDAYIVNNRAAAIGRPRDRITDKAANESLLDLSA